MLKQGFRFASRVAFAGGLGLSALALTGSGCAADAELSGSTEPAIPSSPNSRVDNPSAPATGDRERSINSYVAGLDQLTVEPPSRTASASSPAVIEGDYTCTEQNVSETKQYDKIVALAANSASLWPGAILRGDSVYSGLFTQMVFDRAPLNFSISLENLGGPRAARLEAPSLASFRTAVAGLLDNVVVGATAANITADIESVHSEEQLTLALGANLSWGDVARVSAGFDFSDKDVKSRYVVKYTQTYYTIDIDEPSSPAAMLGPNVSIEEVRSKSGVGNPPVYVQSISYGRTVMFTFESNYSSTEMAAALNFVYNGGVDVSGNTSISHRNLIERSKVSAYILGGSASQAALAIDSFPKLMQFIREGGNYTKDSPGAAIAYKLAYLADNSPARLSFTTDYKIRECARISQKVKVSLKSFRVETADDDNDDLEIYGSIQASGTTSSTLFNRDRSHYVVIGQGSQFPTTGNIAESVINVRPQPGETINLGLQLFDQDSWSGDDSLGNQTERIPFEAGWNKEVQSILTGSASRLIVTFKIEPI